MTKRRPEQDGTTIVDNYARTDGIDLEGGTLIVVWQKGKGYACR